MAMPLKPGLANLHALRASAAIPFFNIADGFCLPSGKSSHSLVRPKGSPPNFQALSTFTAILRI